MATVLITGGTGMIGTALTKALLEKGYEVIILTRNSKQLKIKNEKLKIEYAEWNGEEQTIDENAISKADYIVHLTGANVGEKRWTKKRKKEIVSSRVDSGKLLVESLKKIPNHVKAVVGASAIGYYGPDRKNNSPFQETDPSFPDFLGNTCKQWEESMEPVTSLGKRLVLLRTGIVLCKEGGALPEYLKALQFGLATVLGTGKQIISWIHIDDLVNLYIYAIENENLSGIYNAVTPNSVSNKEFVSTLAKTRNKFFIVLRVPSFILKIVLGEMSIEVLKSTTVSSEKIEKAGFTFLYPTIKAAFKNL
jgi:uncharacterized protein (TIGR01777 family)